MSFSKTGKRPVKNSQFSNPTPDHLRTLVLDYLCHNCYTDTARAFARDSEVRHLDRDGDDVTSSSTLGSDNARDLSNELLRLVELRQQIRIHILSGRVDEAIALLNEHFPLVLGETENNTHKRTEPPASLPGQVDYLAPTSVDPTHLSLNLRIMAFIEASRTVPLEYDPRPLPQTEKTLPVPSTHKKESSIYEADDPEAKQIDLLFRAQKLYAAANLLHDPSDRARYLKELGNVGGLLAYKEPESSPMAKYLSQERRESVADQINGAILYRTGRPAVSNLELYTRYTSATWTFMNSQQMKFQGHTKRPSGVSFPPTNASKASAQPPSKSTDNSEDIPAFDLRQFLESKK